MNSKRKTLGYDLFKLIIALIMVVILVILLIQGPQVKQVSVEPEAAERMEELLIVEEPEPEGETGSGDITEPDQSSISSDSLSGAPSGDISSPDLPPLPESDFVLIYDPENDTLITPDGTAVYRLNTDLQVWEPIISDDLMGKIPDGAFVTMDESGIWQIVDPNGLAFYNWEPQTLAWQIIESPDISEPDLPPFPDAGVELLYQSDSNTLTDPNGNAIYILDTDNFVWKPILPDDIAGDLPGGAEISQDENDSWYIFGSDGGAIYSWDSNSSSWRKVEPDTSDLPPFPDVDVDLLYQAEDNTLTTPDGIALFQLNIELNLWEPMIPDEITSSLPDGVKSSPGEGGLWTLTSASGEPLYTWDPANLAWDPVTPAPVEPPTHALCPLTLPPKLRVGIEAEVISNLNLRSSPGIGNNWLQTMRSGTKVKVIGGPICLTHEEGEYLWWQLELDDGQTGWSAEAAFEEYYFLEPLSE
jgi:hypothetical protein